MELHPDSCGWDLLRLAAVLHRRSPVFAGITRGIINVGSNCQLVHKSCRKDAFSRGASEDKSCGKDVFSRGRLQGYVMQERCVEHWGLQEQVKSCRKDMFSGWAFEDAGRMCLESKKRHFLRSIEFIGNYRRFPIKLR